MADTIHQLLARMGPKGKIVVWGHNSHQGDARASDQGLLDEVSLGQLMQEAYCTEVALIGFSTHRGWVRATSEWGGKDRVCGHPS